MKFFSCRLFKFICLSALIYFVSFITFPASKTPLSGQVNVVMEENNLYVEVYLMSAPIIGFDNIPDDVISQQKIKEMLIKFEDNSSIFVLPEVAECSLITGYTDYLSSDNGNFVNTNEAELIINEEELQEEMSGLEEKSDVPPDAETDNEEMSGLEEKSDVPPDVEIDNEILPEAENKDIFETEDRYEFYMVYEFRCKNPGKISIIPLTLFKNYKNVKTLMYYGTVQGQESEAIIENNHAIQIGKTISN